MNGRLFSLAINPWVTLAALALGTALGIWLPGVALKLGFVGDVYVDLLMMIVLPFMLSAVIFSLQNLLRNGGAATILKRTCVVFGLVLAVVAALGVATSLVQLGGSPTPSQIEAYGRIVGSNTTANDTVLELGQSAEVKTAGLADTLRSSLVPTNVFAALANGETLKALVFALLFGVAVGNVKNGLSDGLGRGLQAIYEACQRLTKWLSVPLPVVLVCMTAGQLAKTGVEPMRSMVEFIGLLALASALVVGLAVLVVWWRSGQGLLHTLRWLRAPFALALATRSSATCMPAMIETLSVGLGFPRGRVELLVPLSVSLLRIGPILYYVCATLFIAHIYARPLSAGDLLLVGAASVLAGCASAGMSGLVTVSLTGMVCGYLGLPFEAAFVLFLAVDPLCDMLRTLVLVIGNSAAVSLICDRPGSDAQQDAAHSRYDDLVVVAPVLAPSPVAPLVPVVPVVPVVPAAAAPPRTAPRVPAALQPSRELA